MPERHVEKGFRLLLVENLDAAVMLGLRHLVIDRVVPMRRHDINRPPQRSTRNLERLAARGIDVGRRKPCLQDFLGFQAKLLESRERGVAYMGEPNIPTRARCPLAS